MPEKILFIGGTGLLGEPVAHSLQKAGFLVRVMSRHVDRASFSAPFELVEGNALNRTDVENAVADCDAVHLSIDHDREDDCVAGVVEAAQAMRLKRITYVSGTTVCEENRWFPMVHRKLQSEEVIRNSGIEYTIFCPTWFMEMLPRFVRNGSVVIFGRPSRRWHFVSVQDFARMVSESYRCPEAVGQRFYVHGPQALNLSEALHRYCQALHPEIKTFRHIPYWLLRLIGWMSGNESLSKGVEIVAYLEKVGERGDPTEANAILGAPQITLDEWLKLQNTPTPNGAS